MAQASAPEIRAAAKFLARKGVGREIITPIAFAAKAKTEQKPFKVCYEELQKESENGAT